MPDPKVTENSPLKLEPNTLWSRAIARSERALARGSLEPIATEQEWVEENGIRFIVRILASFARKEKAQKQQEKKNFNPFLPPEEDLLVADISETHSCLLNKYNVVDYHLLIVTRRFEEQDNWLTLADFQALWACLEEIDGLGFYNGGKLAGSSQPHKHLQLVPLPLIPGGPILPIEPAIATARWDGNLGTVPSFPFRHCLASLDPSRSRSPLEAAAAAFQQYRTLLAAVGLPVEGERQSGAYNLLLTRRWMLVVPRSREKFDSIDVNALGFAGALLVRDREQLQRLKAWGPMAILKQVAQLK